MDPWIASVQTHQNMIRIVFQVIHETGLYFIKWCQNLVICVIRIDSINFPVLITSLVINVNQTVIPDPEIAGNVSLRRVRDARNLIGTDFPHMDIHTVFPRLHERQLGSVRGNLETGHGGIPEEIFHWNQRCRML